MRPLWPLAALAMSACAPRTDLQSQLEREIVALHQRMQILEEDLAACGTPGAQGSLYATLFQVFSGSAATIDQRGPATVITVRSSHLFTDRYASAFRDEAEGTLDLVATALLLNPEYDISVVGHTNTAPIQPPHNRRYFNHVALSLGLAARLTDHLITNYTVPEERFTVAGRGTWDPRASNQLPDGQDENHRIEIRLVRGISEPGTP